MAWTNRHALDGPELNADEIDFLPAHLELVERPASPTARWAMRLIVGLFAIALLWSIFGKVDIVAVATGKTVASSRTKVVQPAETALVKRILIQDGQVVKAGDPLIELDATATGADVDKASEALLAAKLTALRLSAIANALDHGGSPVLTQDESLSKERFKAEQALATSQYVAYLAKKDNSPSDAGHGVECRNPDRQEKVDRLRIESVRNPSSGIGARTMNLILRTSN